MFSSSAIHTQTTALGEGVKQCTVGRSTIATITTRDWQVIDYTLTMGKNLGKKNRNFFVKSFSRKNFVKMISRKIHTLYKRKNDNIY